jgi:hypothetical protein
LQRTEFEFKERLRKTLKKYSIILAVGFAYLFFTLLTDLGIPCVFNKLTGLKCPGCGATRMFKAIARFDLKAAFGFNPFLFITGPFLLAYLVYSDTVYVLRNTMPNKKWDILLTAELIIALIYGILRNIFPI